MHMDDVNWEHATSEIGRNNTPMLWRRQKQGHDEGGGYSIPNNSNLTSCLLTYPNSENLIHFQQQDVVKSSSSSLGVGAIMSLSENGPYNNMDNNYQISGKYIMEDFNMAQYNHQQQQQQSNNNDSCCSLDHHCLISSATNSNTNDDDNNNNNKDNDDGISKILLSDGDCTNYLWNLSGSTDAASSAESESNYDNASMLPCSHQNNSDHQQYINQGGQFNPTILMNEDQSPIIKIENPPRSKKPRWEKTPFSSTISFQNPNEASAIMSSTSVTDEEADTEAMAQMKEMIYRAAAFRPVNLLDSDEVMEKPKRKNVRVSSDPQTVAARQRREKISQKIRVLQKIVPGGTKMDTASMLDEAANYLKFLRSQVKALENLGNNSTKAEAINYYNYNSFEFCFNYPSFHSQIHYSLLQG